MRHRRLRDAPRPLVLVAVLIAWGALAGPPGPHQAATGGALAQAAQPAGAAARLRIKVKTPDDRRVVEFKLGDHVTIELGATEPGRVLRGEAPDGDKRKYRLDGRVIVEVKHDADAFKVRAPDGRLLWKVKLDARKVKISNHEDGRDPVEIAASADGYKVKRGEQKLGEVKVQTGRGRVKVKDAAERERFEASTAHQSAAFGVLLVTAIPEIERVVIMAELLGRDR
jgi:hypothetical protein